MKKNMPPATMPPAAKPTPNARTFGAPTAGTARTIAADVASHANRPQQEQAARHAEHNADVQREYDQRAK